MNKNNEEELKCIVENVENRLMMMQNSVNTVELL